MKLWVKHDSGTQINKRKHTHTRTGKLYMPLCHFIIPKVPMSLKLKLKSPKTIQLNDVSMKIWRKSTNWFNDIVHDLDFDLENEAKVTKI